MGSLIIIGQKFRGSIYFEVIKNIEREDGCLEEVVKENDKFITAYKFVENDSQKIKLMLQDEKTSNKKRKKHVK